MLPVNSAELKFSVASGGEPEVPERRGETRPRPRYEEADTEGTLRNEDTLDMGKKSLSTLNDPAPPSGTQSDNDDDNDDDVRQPQGLLSFRVPDLR